MKFELNAKNGTIIAGVALAVLALLFWTQLLSPKRDEAKKLGVEVERLEASLAAHETEIAEGEEARSEFSTEYQRLVVVGKAVPGDDDIASLLVQLNRIADRADGEFRNIQLSAEGGGEAPPTPAASGETASATEVAASLLPLGATIGPAGLAVMPYEVTFDGNFFDVADFIKGLDSLVETKQGQVTVDGRLVTINSFTLEAGATGFPTLDASFSLTTYLTPPGAAAGTTPAAPGEVEAAPVAATTGVAP